LYASYWHSLVSAWLSSSARADEKKAIEMYKQIIEMSRKESDETTALLFMEILKDEEDHHDTFETLLQQV
jgi:bacterioferritin